MEQTNGNGLSREDGSTVINLAGFDQIWARYYSSMVLTFRPRPGLSQTEVVETLQTSLEKTCHKVPIFRSRVFDRPADDERPAQGQMELRTNPDWVPRIVHKDLSDKLPEYDELEDAGFPPGYFEPDVLLPPNLAYTPPATGAPVIVVQASFIKGGLLLGARIHHGVADGTGAVFFFKHWAQQARLLQRSSSAASEVSFDPGSYDRSQLHSFWESRGRPIADATDASQWRLLGSLPPAGPFEIPSPHPEMSAGFFFVSADSFKALTLEGQQKKKSVSDLSLSANDVLSAFLWRTSIRARKNGRTPTSTEDYAGEKLTYMDMVLNGRAFVGSAVPWDYIANMVLFASPNMTVEKLLDSSTSLATIAESVHKTASSITLEQALAAYGLATTIKDYRFIPYAFAALEDTEVFVNSYMALQYQEASFGDLFLNDGCPDVGRPLYLEFGGYARRIISMPMNQQGGFEIFVEMPAKEIQALQEDDEFTRYAQFLC